MLIPTRVAGIIIKDNNILLIHRKKPDDEYWVFPGGSLEDTDVSPEEGLLKDTKDRN